MSNTNNNLQTQTPNALHNSIMEAGGKDRPPMLAPGNYNPPYKFKWTEKTVPVAEGSSKTTTEGYIENYKNVSQDIRDQLNVEAKAQYQNEVNEIRAERLARTANLLALIAQQQPVYHPQNDPNHNTQYSSTRSQQATRNRGKAIVNSSAPIYDQEPTTVTEYDEMSKEKEINKLKALISLSFKKIYKPTNNNLRTSSNTNRANQDNSPRINRGTGVITTRNMGMFQGNLNAEQTDWKDDIDDKFNDQELEAHYMYIAQIQEDDADELAQECDLLASFIDKQKCEIDDSKNRNKFLESSHKALVDKLKGEIKDLKTKNKSLESSNNHFKEANNELSMTNQLMFKDLKKFQSELDKYHDVNYASKVAIDGVKAKGDLMSYKIEFEKSSTEYTRKINDLNQTISDMKKELFAHQENIFIMSQEKEAQIKLYKTREDKELDKVIALENRVKFLKKAQRANPHLYDIGCYNDNLALMLACESGETIRLDKESLSKLSDLIRPFNYDQLNNLYDLFVPQRERSPEQHYFPRMSKMSHTSSNNEISKESFRKQTTLLEKQMDESIPWDQKCKSSKELFKIKKSVDTIFDGVERCKRTMAKRTYFEKFHLCLNEEMVADLTYFNSLEHEVDTLKSQLETQKTQFLNEIDRLSREYYYTDHANAILGVYTDIDEVSNLQCDYLETLEKCEHLEKELSKSRTMSKSFEALQKHAINLELDLQQCREKIENDKSFKENQSNVFLKEREQYFEIQDLKAQLQDKGIAISELKKLIEKMKGKSVETKPQLKSNRIGDRVLPNNSQGKKQEVEDHSRDFKFSNNKIVIPSTSVSRPQLKSNRIGDRVLPNNSQGKKQEVEDHRRNFKFSIIEMVESINTKKYVLVIIDDYSRYTWTRFLRSKDETLTVLIDFLTLVQRGLHAQVRTVRTDKGTEFLNKTLHAYFTQEGIRHETSTARTPKQNGVVKRRNRTLVEAARTMLSTAKVILFFWAEAISTTCFTQNRSLVIPRHEKTPYHIINGQKPPMFDELLNRTTPVVSKPSAVHVADAPDKRQHQNITHYSTTTVVAAEPPLDHSLHYL
ncbi:retrovirus-related pol polyprotein from transposon TNT 1-94 [Tanacetum coccineum]